MCSVAAYDYILLVILDKNGVRMPLPSKMGLGCYKQILSLIIIKFIFK